LIACIEGVKLKERGEKRREKEGEEREWERKVIYKR